MLGIAQLSWCMMVDVASVEKGVMEEIRKGLLPPKTRLNLFTLTVNFRSTLFHVLTQLSYKIPSKTDI
jgi:hypothetical protein